MGLRARILGVIKSAMQRFQENPGQSAVVQLQSNAGEVLQIEGFQPSGFAGVPPAGVKAIVLQLGDSPTQAVVIALQNYQITLSLAQGECMLYSTTADGKTLKAQVYLDASGLIHVKNQNQSLATALNNLINGIQGATCPSGGGPLVDTTGKIATALSQLGGLLA